MPHSFPPWTTKSSSNSISSSESSKTDNSSEVNGTSVAVSADDGEPQVAASESAAHACGNSKSLLIYGSGGSEHGGTEDSSTAADVLGSASASSKPVNHRNQLLQLAQVHHLTQVRPLREVPQLLEVEEWRGDTPPNLMYAL